MPESEGTVLIPHDEQIAGHHSWNLTNVSLETPPVSSHRTYPLSNYITKTLTIKIIVSVCMCACAWNIAEGKVTNFDVM